MYQAGGMSAAKCSAKWKMQKTINGQLFMREMKINEISASHERKRK
jgi:hypothetical protein